ncbi:hypothetical protein [Camelimonas lactis]|uniref:Uncharacterized protein n=1 Tax=Camelimonas lactis TaxID=659006 RepID=A0A4R2GHH3_9HYPH|nr:hypothetical protein [Camelimonas lactis]TCO07604.1 hypothetical protein EV666_13015 [Camelimonas lactis]
MNNVALFPPNRTRQFRALEADALKLAGGVHGSVSSAAHRFAQAWQTVPHLRGQLVAAATQHLRDRIQEHRATVGLVARDQQSETASVVTLSRP